jgi:hypothetical protein
MWPFGGLAILRGKEDLEGVLRAEPDNFRECTRFIQSIMCVRTVSIGFWTMKTYFSLAPPPTPLPLLCTIRLASVNPQPDAAAAKGARAASRRAKRVVNSLILSN